MKLLKSYFIVALLLMIGTSTFAQSMKKKYRTVKTTVKINAPAEKVWAVISDYGAIGNFSPYIYSSGYLDGSLNAKPGAQRHCTFDKKGKRWVKEKVKTIDHENMTMTSVPIDGKKVPLNFDNSRAFYTVVDNGDGTSTAGYEFQFRTKPSFLGLFAKGGFKKQLGGTLIGLKHYVETGEKVTPMNKKYKEIKNKYPKYAVVK